ncbi:hypothetical protein Tco_0576068 [Tanacetum coccineum]
MAALKYRDEHNRIGFLEKPKGSTDYHQVIDFLLDSHIRYAIVTDPLIYDSLITQFWSTASLRSSELGPPAIVATIDGTPYTITESLVRSQLQLHDEGGIVDMPIPDIFLGMDNLGYPTEGKLTFHKNKFSPQWRFLIHTLLHCLSTKSGSWDQFGSPLAIALICLCEGKKYNWSRYIFTGMVNNINNSKKFLMFPRFLQMILDIETRNTKPYHAFRLTSKMFANMRLNFHGDHMPLVAAMLPPPQAAIAAGTSGEAAQTNPQTAHEPVTDPMHPTASSHDHGSTSPRPTPTTPAAQLNEPVSKPPRPIPTSPSAQVNQQGPSSDPHVESSSKDNDSNPDPNVADDPLGGSFFASPSRSTAAPPEGTTSGGAADPHNLTALYTLVSEQGKKIESLESELQAHKLLFKDVMGKLVKRVKFLESKLKARGRNVILSESDNEEDEEQDVDSLIKLAKAAAIAADTSSVPADATQATEFPPSSSIHTDAFVHGNDVPTGTASDFSADPSNKGKSPMVEEDPPIKERSFRQMEEDRLGAEAARKLYEEEQAELARVQEEMKKKRQEDVINSAKYYTDADWSDIMGQVHANQGLTADLLGPDVNEENFAERMVAIIAERRRRFEAQRLLLLHMIHLLIPLLLLHHLLLHLFLGHLDLGQEVNHLLLVSTRKMSSSEVDLTAPDKSFIQVLSNDDSDDSDDDSDPLFFGMYLLHGKLFLLAWVMSMLYTSLEWVIHSWKLFPFSGVHVLETFTGKILYMFADTPYPLSASLMKKMLKHKLEVEINGIGNDMTYAMQLIKFIKNQLASSIPSACFWMVFEVFGWHHTEFHAVEFIVAAGVLKFKLLLLFCCCFNPQAYTYNEIKEMSETSIVLMTPLASVPSTDKRLRL